MARNNSRTLKTTERSFDVAEALKELDGARVTEVADYLGISKSVVHGHLSTLLQRGYLVKEGDEYHLGLRFANLGEYAKTRKSAFSNVKQMATDLAAETNLESDFIVDENGRGVYLKTEIGTTDPNLYPAVGDRVYLHSTAAGKSILANYPRARVESVIDRWGLPAQTENTITDREELLERLETVRELGYGINKGENKPGIRAVGSCVTAPDGSILGAVAVSGPKYRMKGEYFREELPKIVLRYVEELESDL
jgi:DNA-binding IclR family transcriptional regulator